MGEHGRCSLTSSFLCGFSILGGLNSLSIELGVDSKSSELSESLLGLHLLSDSLDLASLGGSWESEDSFSSVLDGTLKSILGGVVDLTLLWCSILQWEEDKLGLVVIKSLNVFSLSSSIGVVSSMVTSDSYSSSEGLGKFGFSKLSERETSSELNLMCVSFGHAVNDGSELADGRNSSCGCLGSSGLLSQLLVSSLVEEALDSSHPMLSQVGALKDIIVFYHVAY